MDIKTLNKICFTVCIVCIIAGIVLGLGLIWGSPDNEILWKGLASVLVLFTGSAMALAVSNTFNRASRPKPSDDHGA